jgi:hypothetical protein
VGREDFAGVEGPDRAGEKASDDCTDDPEDDREDDDLSAFHEKGGEPSGDRSAHCKTDPVQEP